MIFWHTDNEISQAVAKAVSDCGNEAKHIRHFSLREGHEGDNIFYGILRGTGSAMRICQYFCDRYFYLDNGYFDAEYIDQHGFKSMDGKYRIVKNDMVEKYEGPVIEGAVGKGKTFLIIPPSPYTANFYDTTPEDWMQEWIGILHQKGFVPRIRDKKNIYSSLPLAEELKAHDYAGILAFNSMAMMTAVKHGVPAYDTHGLFRNADRIRADDFTPRIMYAYEDVRAFYEPKNFTLQEIAEGKSCL